VNSAIRNNSGIPENEGDPSIPFGVIHHSPGALYPRCDSRAESLIVHRSLKDLEKREAVWGALGRSGSDPFQMFSWCHAFYSAYEDMIGAPLVFELSAGGESRAFLPCYVDGSAIRLAGDRLGLVSEVIAKDMESVSALLVLAMEWMADESGASHFHFETIRESGLLNQAIRLSDESGERSLSIELSRTSRGMVAVGSGLRDYFSGLPEERRTTEVDAFHRFEKVMPFSRDTVLRNFEIRVDDLANAGRFHFENDPTGKGSPFGDEQIFDFFGRVVKDPDLGFQLGFLTCQGDLLAMEFGFLRGDTYYVYLTRNDPGMEFLAPGRCLIQRRLDSFRLAGVERIVYLGAGDSDATTLFCQSGETLRSVQWMPVGFRNRARRFGLNSLHQIRSRLSTTDRESGAILSR
jgi:CelD/BcsL family acetyltransferase involved in cellulose biosynthesis